MKKNKYLIIFVACIIALFSYACSNDNKQEENNYVYSYGGISVIKTDGWEIKDMNNQASDEFMYYSDNGVIDIYFRQIEGMDDEELNNYMNNGMPNHMEEGLQGIGYENIMVTPSSVGIMGKEFPSCFATYEYQGEKLEECIFAHLVDEEIMLIDICAFRGSTIPQLLELIEYNE